MTALVGMTLTRSFRMLLKESKQERRKTQNDGVTEGPNTKDASGVYLNVSGE